MPSTQSPKLSGGKYVLSLVAGVVFSGAAFVSFPNIAAALKVAQVAPQVINSPQPIEPPQKPAAPIVDNVISPSQTPRIQMAILVDTSGSMQGLIDQTKNQLWSIVNEFSNAKRNGQVPILELALYEYGAQGTGVDEKFIRQLNDFTSELDLVSEGLFSLRTSGSEEYCGAVIDRAVSDLQWSQSNNDIKAIFIAGNEAFSQGPINYQSALRSATQKGIVVSTIYAGNNADSDSTGWKSGAQLAGGNFMSIDANQQIVHINAPQDKRIAELNSRLNETYVPYGSKGVANVRRQLEQDVKNSDVSSALLAKRAKSKSSSYYSNESWDLVDALGQGEVKEAELSSLKKDQLPEVMRDMSGPERKAHIAKQSKERATIKQEIAQLSEERERFVTNRRKQQRAQPASMSDALTAALKSQAKKKGYQLDEKTEG